MSSIIMKETAQKVDKNTQYKIDSAIEHAVKRLNRNGQYALLTLESTAALSAGQARWRELKEQGTLKRMFRSITGKNRSVREAMEQDIFHFQYTAQKMLQVLADQQCFTLDIVAAVHKNFNLLIQENDMKFEKIYHHLHEFFDHTEKNLRDIHSRIDQTEKKLDLLHWNVTIKRRMYNGIAYEQLSDAEKIICIARDFFELTNGEWNDQELLVLETAMDLLDMSHSISLTEFFTSIGSDHGLIQHLLDPVSRIDAKNEPSLELHPLVIFQEMAGSNKPEQFMRYQQKYKMETLISMREIVYELISGMSVLKELSELEEEEDDQYEVVLNSCDDPDLRIDVVREIRAHTRLPVEECRQIVKNTPSRVFAFDTYEDAEKLKQLLEKHCCQVAIH